VSACGGWVRGHVDDGSTHAVGAGGEGRAALEPPLDNHVEGGRGQAGVALDPCTCPPQPTIPPRHATPRYATPRVADTGPAHGQRPRHTQPVQPRLAPLEHTRTARLPTNNTAGTSKLTKGPPMGKPRGHACARERGAHVRLNIVTQQERAGCGRGRMASFVGGSAFPVRPNGTRKTAHETLLDSQLYASHAPAVAPGSSADSDTSSRAAVRPSVRAAIQLRPVGVISFAVSGAQTWGALYSRRTSGVRARKLRKRCTQEQLAASTALG
jgi:hypothetical protein